MKLKPTSSSFIVLYTNYWLETVANMQQMSLKYNKMSLSTSFRTEHYVQYTNGRYETPETTWYTGREVIRGRWKEERKSLEFCLSSVDIKYFSITLKWYHKVPAQCEARCAVSALLCLISYETLTQFTRRWEDESQTSVVHIGLPPSSPSSLTPPAAFPHGDYNV